MTSDLKDKQIRSLQAETIDDLAKTLKVIFEISKTYNETAEQKNWKQNRTMNEIQTATERALTRLDCKGASLDLIKREIPKDQKRLPT